jgi:hypothetical protein
VDVLELTFCNGAGPLIGERTDRDGWPMGRMCGEANTSNYPIEAEAVAEETSDQRVDGTRRRCVIRCWGLSLCTADLALPVSSGSCDSRRSGRVGP